MFCEHCLREPKAFTGYPHPFLSPVVTGDLPALPAMAFECLVCGIRWHRKYNAEEQTFSWRRKPFLGSS